MALYEYHYKKYITERKLGKTQAEEIIKQCSTSRKNGPEHEKTKQSSTTEAAEAAHPQVQAEAPYAVSSMHLQDS